MSNTNTMKQSPTPTPRLPSLSYNNSCCCDREYCHARARWQNDIQELKNDMHELKSDAREVADIAQELLKENEEHVKTIKKLSATVDHYKEHAHELILAKEVATATRHHLDRQLTDKCQQLELAEARLDQVNTKYKNLKLAYKEQSTKIKKMQLFVQSTVCEAATRENQLRQKLKIAEDKIKTGNKITEDKNIEDKIEKDKITADTHSNQKHDAPLMDYSLSSHTKPLPRSTQLGSFPSNETQQPSISKTASWGTTLTATSCNNKAYAPSTSQQQQDQSNKSETKDQHSPASSGSMMKRSKPFIFKNIQPIKIWTIQVQSALKRLRATDLITIKKKVGRPYDKAQLSETSNSFIQSILFDIERLHTNEDPSTLDLCKLLLQEIGELRTRLNDCL